MVAALALQSAPASAASSTARLFTLHRCRHDVFISRKKNAFSWAFNAKSTGAKSSEISTSGKRSDADRKQVASHQTAAHPPTRGTTSKRRDFYTREIAPNTTAFPRTKNNRGPTRETRREFYSGRSRFCDSTYNERSGNFVAPLVTERPNYSRFFGVFKTERGGSDGVVRPRFPVSV